MKVIPNTKELYYASEDGHIYRNEKRLKPINNGKGYLCVVLCIDGKTKREYIHRLICQTYKENTYKKKEVNHLDGDKSNNHINNLEWSTRSENQKHRYDVLGHRGANLGKVGKLNGQSKSISKYSKEGSFICSYESVLSAERETGICESTIRSVAYGIAKSAGGYLWKYN